MWVNEALDQFIFSGSEIASGGQPVYLGVSGTVRPTGSAEGGIYGGAMSSGSGSATSGRPPYIGRNSISMPGYNNADFHITRKFPIREGMNLNLIGEAFNIANHTITTAVNSTYSTFVTSAKSYTTSGGTSVACSSTGAAPSGSSLFGCFAPYTGTGTSAFNTMSSTNDSLYGPRQLQVSAKFTF
jgi:hypothetical protein